MGEALGVILSRSTCNSACFLVSLCRTSKWAIVLPPQHSPVLSKGSGARKDEDSNYISIGCERQPLLRKRFDCRRTLTTLRDDPRFGGGGGV